MRPHVFEQRGNWATVPDLLRPSSPRRAATSWWTEAPREGFTAFASRQAEGMRNSLGSRLVDLIAEKQP